MNKQVGRPKGEKKVKIGLSVDAESYENLTVLADKMGKTKSRVFEEAIRYFESRENIIQERIRDIQDNGLDATLDLKTIIKN